MKPANRNDLLFVFGSARSGTTFLAKLLDASPETLYRHEPDISLPTNEMPFLPARSCYEPMLPAARRYIEQLATVRAARTVGSPPYFRKGFRSPAANLLWQANSYLTKFAERQHLKVPVFDWKRSSQPATILIKSVSSVVRAGLFHMAEPGARMIHLVRNPCAVVSSRKRGLSGGHLDKPAYIEEALGMEEAQNYPLSASQVRNLGTAGQIAYVWMLHNDKVYSELEGEAHYRFVSYEALCMEPTLRTRELYAFANLAWQDQTANFVSSLEDADEAKAGFFGVKRNVRSGLHKWRTDLSTEEIEEIEWVVGQSVLGRRFLDSQDAEMGEKQLQDN